MIVLQNNLALETVSALLLFSIRLAGLFLVAPIFSATAVSLPIRIGLTFAIALHETKAASDKISPTLLPRCPPPILIGPFQGWFIPQYKPPPVAAIADHCEHKHAPSVHARISAPP
jgi:flagellar biosynthesis protein FliR